MLAEGFKFSRKALSERVSHFLLLLIPVGMQPRPATAGSHAAQAEACVLWVVRELKFAAANLSRRKLNLYGYKSKARSS